MYLSAKQIKEKYQITSQTLYNWRRNGKIVFERLPSGRIVYQDLEQVNNPKKKNVFYARVSNTKQKDDLERQKQMLRSFMAATGLVIGAEYSDVASGMNENRKSFTKLIEACIAGEIDKVFITYKDRITRFGFGYIESFLKHFGVEIVVINSTKEEEFQIELAQDLVSIIHHFSMKMYSNRRKKLKEVETEIQEDLNTYNNITE